MAAEPPRGSMPLARNRQSRDLVGTISLEAPPIAPLPVSGELDVVAHGERRIVQSGRTLADTPSVLNSGTVLSWALDSKGCRMLQTLLKVSSTSAQQALIAGLRGHVLELLASPHGNHVLQRIVEALPVGTEPA